jgi:hypothetical protein
MLSSSFMLPSFFALLAVCFLQVLILGDILVEPSHPINGDKNAVLFK